MSDKEPAVMVLDKDQRMISVSNTETQTQTATQIQLQEQGAAGRVRAPSESNPNPNSNSNGPVLLKSVSPDPDAETEAASDAASDADVGAGAGAPSNATAAVTTVPATVPATAAVGPIAPMLATVSMSVESPPDGKTSTAQMRLAPSTPIQELSHEESHNHLDVNWESHGDLHSIPLHLPHQDSHHLEHHHHDHEDSHPNIPIHKGHTESYRRRQSQFKRGVSHAKVYEAFPFRERLRLVFCPIRVFDTIEIDPDDDPEEDMYGVEDHYDPNDLHGHHDFHQPSHDPSANYNYHQHHGHGDRSSMKSTNSKSKGKRKSGKGGKGGKGKGGHSVQHSDNAHNDDHSIFSQTKNKNDKGIRIKDTYTRIEIVPESLRILSYTMLIAYTIVSIIISIITGVPDYHDNALRDYFGFSNLCVFFDEPPMVYIVPFWYTTFVLLPMLGFLILDNFRVYDQMKDHQLQEYEGITKSFYVKYTIVSGYIIFSFLLFTITFAVAPYEDIGLHTYPFLLVMLGWLFLSFQRFFYYRQIGIWREMAEKSETYGVTGKRVSALGAAYLWTLSTTVVIATVLNGPGSDLIWGYPGPTWRAVVGDINDKVLTGIVFLVPMVYYLWFTPCLDTIEIVVNRKVRGHKMGKQQLAAQNRERHQSDQKEREERKKKDAPDYKSPHQRKQLAGV